MFDVIWVLIILALMLASQWANRRQSAWHIGLSCLGWLALSVLLVRTFFWEPYTTQGPSMSPTLPPHSWVVVNRQAYGVSWPAGHSTLWSTNAAHQDIVAFQHQSEVWVKRVRATPGDILQYSDTTGWYVNDVWVAPPSRHSLGWLEHGGLPNDHTFSTASRVQSLQEQWGRFGGWSIKVPPNFVFVVGDNPAHSTDSRDEGLVHMSKILGRIDWSSKSDTP